MLLRKAEKEEFPTVQTFYWELIDQMEGQKDTVGWKKGIYPTDEFLKESIDNGELYVIDGSEGIIASVIVNSSWNEGYEGITWGIACPREEILVPHALGVSAKEQRRGIGKDLFWKGCPGPLPDGSCRTPEETCNNPSCSARG